MLNRKNLFTILTLITLSGIAFAAPSSLVDVDVKKSGNDTVNFILYSSNPSSSGAMVRKKDGNKYVILIPNTSSQVSSINFNSVKDLISDVEVKTVKDTSDGYTKVTVTAKQPLNINAKTVMSKPVTQEQIAYRNLLQEANTPKPNSIQTVAKPTKSMEGNMIVQPSNSTTAKSKSPATDKSSKSQPAQASAPTTSKVSQVKPQQPVVQQPMKSDVQKTEQKPIVEQPIPVVEKTVAESSASVASQVPTVKELPIKPKVDLGKEIHNKLSSIKSGTIALGSEMKNSIPKEKPTLPDIPEIPLFAKYIAGGVLGLFLIKTLASLLGTTAKSSQRKVATERSVYSSEKAANTGILNNKYAAITSDENLNWRAKYNKYNEAVNNPEVYEQEKLEAARKRRYKFISDSRIVNKRNSLENMYQVTDSQSGGLYSEDSQIPLSIEDIKFKGFGDDAIELKQTDRNKTTSRFKRYEKMQEIEPAELGLSKLNKNMRKFSDGNLNVFDVKRKTKSIRELKRIEDLKAQDYVMSSLDEFFSVMDDTAEKVSQVSEPQYENENYRTIKMISRVNMPQKSIETHGINLDKAFGKATSGSVEDNEKGLDVTSSYDLDSNHSFYMVNFDGKSALIAKCNDEINVIKQFDSIVSAPIQVRQDRPNVYMVRTEGFKSMVEINGDKAGVLVEL
jgi:hypothetical protein